MSDQQSLNGEILRLTEQANRQQIALDAFHKQIVISVYGAMVADQFSHSRDAAIAKKKEEMSRIGATEEDIEESLASVQVRVSFDNAAHIAVASAKPLMVALGMIK